MKQLRFFEISKDDYEFLEKFQEVKSMQIEYLEIYRGFLKRKIEYLEILLRLKEKMSENIIQFDDTIQHYITTNYLVTACLFSFLILASVFKLGHTWIDFLIKFTVA